MYTRVLINISLVKYTTSCNGNSFNASRKIFKFFIKMWLGGLALYLTKMTFLKCYRVHITGLNNRHNLSYIEKEGFSITQCFGRILSANLYLCKDLLATYIKQWHN